MKVTELELAGALVLLLDAADDIREDPRVIGAQAILDAWNGQNAKQPASPSGPRNEPPDAPLPGPSWASAAYPPGSR